MEDIYNIHIFIVCRGCVYMQVRIYLVSIHSDVTWENTHTHIHICVFYGRFIWRFVAAVGGKLRHLSRNVFIDFISVALLPFVINMPCSTPCKRNCLYSVCFLAHFDDMKEWPGNKTWHQYCALQELASFSSQGIAIYTSTHASIYMRSVCSIVGHDS